MKSRKKKKIELILISAMLILCILAGLYISRLVKIRAERAKAIEAAEQEKQEAAELAQKEEKDKAEERAEHIYAYRGSDDDALYTMASYDAAVEAGAGVIVLPFVVSQDGTLYVADDDYAQNLTGYGGYFSGMTDSQIENLETEAGTKVLKLSDVFDKYGKDVKYVIDMKYVSPRNQDALKSVIKEYEFDDNVKIACRYFSGIKAMENFLPDIPKIFVCQDSGEFNEALYMSQIDEISVTKDMMSDDLCKTVHDNGKKFGAWNLNTEEEIRKAIDMGADSYFTDEATMAVSIEESSRD